MKPTRIIPFALLLALVSTVANGALPNQLKSARIIGSTSASTTPTHITDIETAITDIFGIPINTNISAALLEVVAAGLKAVNFQDAAGDPGSAGKLQRNAANLKFHDGTAARTVALLGALSLDAEAAGNTVTVPIKFTIPVAGCGGTSAGASLDLHTSSTAVPACYGTNPHRLGALEFADGSDRKVGGHFLLPSDWTGAISVSFYWIAASASTNSVVWTLETACVADGEDMLNPTYNAIQSTTDANAGSGLRNSDGIVATTTGCAAGETFFFKAGRDGDAGADNLAATAALVDLEVLYRRAL